MGVIASLREATWLDRGRVVGYSRVLLALTLLVAIGWIALARDGIDRSGTPLGSDFLSFRAAAGLAVDGHPAAAYSVASHAERERSLFGGRDVPYYAFFYPPPFLLLVLPLGFLPYWLALVAWISATFAAFWRVIRTFLPERDAIVPILAFPAVFSTIGHGQNAFLTTALFGVAALCLGRRPFVAGLCCGALIVKPHLGLVIPVALLAAGAWRAIAGAALSSLGTIAASALLFGTETWHAFFASNALARSTLEDGTVGYAKMQSAFAAMKLWGASTVAAYGVQAAVTLAALAIVALAGRRAGPGTALGATIAAASLMASPFLLDYDLAIAAIPLAFLVEQGLRTGFRPYEKVIVFTAYLLPLLSRSLATAVFLPLGPLVTALLLAAVFARATALAPRIDRTLATATGGI